jgi:hypothetical protein
VGVERWCWLALVVGAALTGMAWSQQQAGPDWLSVNGDGWRRMKPEARLAYVDGFLAGAAVSQAASQAHDTAAVRATLEELSRSRRFRFPFGSNVYASRVSDFYWWKNHLPLPTWYAFLEVNTTLGRPISADSLR